MCPIFIYINGYPGVGKLAVASALRTTLKDAKVFDNHRLIDCTSSVYGRGMPEYQPLRRQMRRLVLDSIAASESTRNNTWIFTDQQSSSENGTSAARDYAIAARARKSPFVSIILQCSFDENVRRLTSTSRGGGTNTKLTDVNVLKTIRDTEDIYHFGGDLEIEIDVTDKSPDAVAKEIKDFIVSQCGNVYNKYGFPTFSDIPGFKHVFIRNVIEYPEDSRVYGLMCWLKSKPRHHGRLVFCDLVDSTGTIQAVFNSDVTNKQATWIARLAPETSLSVTGYINIPSPMRHELYVTDFSVISAAQQFLTPPVRTSDARILGSAFQDRMLSRRHIYLRSPVLLALNNFRSLVFHSIRVWFEAHGFLDFSAPLITPSLLYEPKSAIHLTNLREDALYLSQCAGFYLEAAAHAHERVYNLGPSFRNESRTNRHLMEYWHIKAELCSGSMEDIIQLVELFLHNIWSSVCVPGGKIREMLGCAMSLDAEIPFQRMTYRAAIDLLRRNEFDISFGANIGKTHERWLTRHAGERPLWITNKPRSLEPFPYSIDPADDQLSMTADLLAPNGFGEICGVAEKSYSSEMLDERLKEKLKDSSRPEYGWVRELHDFGMVPHTAFGIGFERMLRWFCGNDHVKDNIPFPRIFDRRPLP